ncbi:hypothetical protein PINS_up001081 [Pythium insidiosum]|nr:hypothetical protein PINS_up001081 [Pythium insidiosum]
MVATSYHSGGADTVVVSKGIGADVVKPPPVTISAPADDFAVVKLWPTQMRFVTGIAKGYEDDFPPELGHLAEQYVRALIHRINKRPCFSRVGVEWRLARSCGRSWIEISYPTTAKPITEITYQTPGTMEQSLAASLSRQPAANGSSSRRTAASPLIVDV